VKNDAVPQTPTAPDDETTVPGVAPRGLDLPLPGEAEDPSGDAPDPAELAAWLQALHLDDGSAPTGPSPAGTPDGAGPATAPVPPPSPAAIGALYADLKRAARQQLRRESPAHTLSATALVHEAWMRLAAQTRTPWASRRHVMAVAALMMRRILVNHAEARLAAKRDVPLVPLTITEAQQVSAGASADVLALHEALRDFEQVDPRAARVVVLKFFGGLEVEEIAPLLGVSTPTVKRDWALARAWLRRELGASA
jgi:RNA polymerase sigma factor (TIGR02999 family)